MALGLVAVLGQVAMPSQLVIEARQLTAAVVSERAASTSEVREAGLVAGGYTRIDFRGVAYFFSDDLWRKRWAAKMANSLDELKRSLGQSNTLNLTQATPISALVKQLVADTGYQLASGDAGRAVVDRTCTLVLGDRSLQIHFQSQRGSPWNVNSMPRLAPVDKVNRERYAGKRPLTSGISAGGLSFAAYGPLSRDRVATVAAYENACALLKSRDMEIDGRLMPKRQALVDRISGYHIRDYYGVSFQAMPPDLQRDIMSGFNYQAIGLSSASDAKAWLSSAILNGSSASLGISVPGPSGNLAAYTFILP
ncbi:MAG: hypothetical protein ACYC96_01885 [Fimbriimonadaceae bacterium]